MWFKKARFVMYILFVFTAALLKAEEVSNFSKQLQSSATEKLYFSPENLQIEEGKMLVTLEDRQLPLNVNAVYSDARGLYVLKTSMEDSLVGGCPYGHPLNSSKGYRCDGPKECPWSWRK